jgi:hypothetical protein
VLRTAKITITKQFIKLKLKKRPMKAICLNCKQEKFIISKGLCAGCLLVATTVKSAPPATPTTSETNGARVDVPKTNGTVKADALRSSAKCDKCDREFKTLQKLGRLNLCVECYTEEHNTAANLATEYDPKNYKTWPRCIKCHAHVAKENYNAQDNMCFKCLSAKKIKAESLSLQPTDSNKYQEFFNQESVSITDMLKEKGEENGILELRQLIIDTTEALFSQEAQAFQTKTRLQSQKIKYNDLLSGLSAEKQKELRIEDSKYAPRNGEPRKLKSPIAKQAEKTLKIKKSLDEQINAMFGGSLSAAEIEEKKKALGL